MYVFIWTSTYDHICSKAILLLVGEGCTKAASAVLPQ